MEWALEEYVSHWLRGIAAVAPSYYIGNAGIVALWILEPGAILTKVVSTARQFQFDPKEEIPDLQEWIRSRIRDNMLWKQWIKRRTTRRTMNGRPTLEL